MKLKLPLGIPLVLFAYILANVTDAWTKVDDVGRIILIALMFLTLFTDFEVEMHNK